MEMPKTLEACDGAADSSELEERHDYIDLPLTLTHTDTELHRSQPGPPLPGRRSCAVTDGSVQAGEVEIHQDLLQVDLLVEAEAPKVVPHLEDALQSGTEQRQLSAVLVVEAAQGRVAPGSEFGPLGDGNEAVGLAGRDTDPNKGVGRGGE
jgi:hypothetical protein